MFLLQRGKQVFTIIIRNSHFKAPPFEPRTHRTTVAVLWELDSKPPSSVPPHEAAMKLKKTASSLGFVAHMIAYASHRHAPNAPPDEAPRCGVCGRRFYSRERLYNHFKSVHETENAKRSRQIESARGSRRVDLAAKYSAKMDKFRRASRELSAPGDDVGRVGRDEARSRIVGLMEEGLVGCLVLVSDDDGPSGLAGEVLRVAKGRGVRTVVVGNDGAGALRRAADGGFSWSEVVAGKAVKEAVLVLGKWRDRDVLARLEWSYDRAAEKSLCGGEDDDETGSRR